MRSSWMSVMVKGIHFPFVREGTFSLAFAVVAMVFPPFIVCVDLAGGAMVVWWRNGGVSKQQNKSAVGMERELEEGEKRRISSTHGGQSPRIVLSSLNACMN